MTKTTENIPKKRLLGDSSDRHHGEFKKRRPPMQGSRDFPPDCRIRETERRVFKNSRNADSNLGKMTNFHGKDKLMTKTSKNTPKKRHLDDSSDFHHGEFKKHRPPMQDSRDFPPDCRIRETERRVFKNSRNADSNPGKMTNFHGKDKLMTKTSKNTPKKRHLDDSSDLHHGEFKKRRKPAQDSRDFPPDSRITETERRVLKNTRNADSNLGKMTNFYGIDKLTGSQSLENDKGDSFKPKELARNKPPFGSRLPGKVKFLDPRSSKEGHAQEPKVTTTTTRRKNSGNVDSNLGKMTSHGKSQPLKHKEDKELGRNTSNLGESRNRKDKSGDPRCSMEGDARKLEVTLKNLDSVDSNHTRKERVKCEKIKESLIMFDEFNEKLYQENKLKPKGIKIADWRVPEEAAKIVKRRLKLMDPEKKLGPICGVEIGNKFKYRAQLKMIGLHCQLHSGIDYTKIGDKNLAISIVDSHRYSNVSRFSDKLIYCGQGGLGFMRPKLQLEDQKLVRGNLALRNSMDEKNPVRVIRKVQGDGKSEVYVYDGLYIVKKFTQKSEKGKTVFNFELHREPEQPELLRMIRGSR